MSNYNFNKDFIKDKMDQMRKDMASKRPAEQAIRESLDINPSILNHKKEIANRQQRHNPNHYEPRVVNQNQVIQGPEWDKHVNIVLGLEWIPYQPDKKCNKGTTTQQFFGPYMGQDGNKIVMDLSKDMMKFVFSKIEENEDIDQGRTDRYLDSQRESKTLDKDQFIKRVNNSSVSEVCKGSYLSDEVIEEYAPYVDMRQLYRQQGFSEYILENFDYISDLPNINNPLNQILNVIRNNGSTGYVMMHREKVLSIENANFSNKNFFGNVITYDVNMKRAPTESMLGVINKDINAYAAPNLEHDELILIDGKDNFFGFEINTVSGLRANEYYFDLNVTIDFSRIQKFVIFG